MTVRDPAPLVIVQARMASTRLPGKVLKPLLGQPLLLWLVDRIQTGLTLQHRLVVAAPATPENCAIADLCARHGTTCHLVSLQNAAENDVLGRFAWVTTQYPETEQIVRVCGDSPLLDGAVLVALIERHRRLGRSYAHIGIAAEWMDGMDCELITRTALLEAHAQATAPSDREHVTPWIWHKPQQYLCSILPCPLDCRALQVSVDTPRDFEQVENLLKFLLCDRGFGFGWRDVWHTVQRHASLRDWQRTRAPRNQAYLTQRAGERGTPSAAWEAERYREPEHGTRGLIDANPPAVS